MQTNESKQHLDARCETARPFLPTLFLLLASIVMGPTAWAAVLQAVLDQGYLTLSWDASDAKLE
jgi:hypothetical protein